MLPRICVILMSCGLLSLVGCEPSKPVAPANQVESGGGGHGHAHSHSHEDLGPNGGHLIELGDEAYHAEWTHDDENGIVTVFLLDGDAKEPVAIDSKTITITTTVEDTKQYLLDAINATGDPPLASQFQIKDPALLVALSMAGESVEASLTLMIDGELYNAKFERHEHGHGHHH